MLLQWLQDLRCGLLWTIAGRLRQMQWRQTFLFERRRIIWSMPLPLWVTKCVHLATFRITSCRSFIPKMDIVHRVMSCNRLSLHRQSNRLLRWSCVHGIQRILLAIPARWRRLYGRRRGRRWKGGWILLHGLQNMRRVVLSAIAERLQKLRWQRSCFVGIRNHLG